MKPEGGPGWELRTHVRSGLVPTVLANLLWGSVFVVSGVGLRFTGPFQLVFLRFGVGAAVAVAVAAMVGRSGLLAAIRRPPVLGLGALNAGAYLCQYLGQSYTSAAEATLLVNLAPVLVPPMAWLILREPLPSHLGVATILGLGGLGLVAGPPLLSGAGGALGGPLLFLGSLAFSVMIVLCKREAATDSGSSTWILVGTALFLLPTALFAGGSGVLEIPVVGWLAVAWLGIPCGAVALALYLNGLGTLTASTSAMLILLQVLTGLFLSAVFLGSSLSGIRAVGAVAIALALVVSAWPRPPASDRRSARGKAEG